LRVVRLRQFSLKLVFSFFAVLAALVAQDPTSYVTPDVLRVGDRLACRCGTCRNTVGTCPMLHCSSASPLRQRIHEMKARGSSDDSIVSTIVREEGVVALATPPTGSFGGILAWIMPGIALLMGFLVYSRYVRRNQQSPAPLSATDRENIDRFRAQIDRELDEAPEGTERGADTGK
jgi:cytochrome c-type biogenesis protein CcmH/NrfF